MSAWRLFEVVGVELEYMIVSRETLDVLPVCDELFKSIRGAYVSDIDGDVLSWSNELAMHVVELKTNGPKATLEGLAEEFQSDVRRLNGLLKPFGGVLMPTSMHPWMDPHRETRLWPHDSSEIYETYDRIFDCRGHGWSNLQSVHINLPFTGDEEFGRLHAATRVVLPLLPALAASSPVVDGRMTGIADNRLAFYQENQRRLPIVAGRVIPEPVYTEADYRREIFDRVMEAVEPFDVEKLLDPYFLNSRGAIARFDRGAIEIRLLDIQECAQADLAVVGLVIGVVKAICSGTLGDLRRIRDLDTEPLYQLLQSSIRDADRALIDNATYLGALGMTSSQATAGELWRWLAERVALADHEQQHVRRLLALGPLSRRIAKALGGSAGRADLVRVYRQLAGCLESGEFFDPS